MKKTIIMTVLMIATICLTGCSGPEDTQVGVDLAIVYGCHANAPIPVLSSATVADMLYQSTASYGSVTVIVNDGTPHAVASYDIAAPEQNLSGTKREEIAKAQANQIVSVLSSAQASSPEVDTLAAVALAARSLESAQGEKVILAMDSGLSTCGYMDFTQNLIRADEQTVVDYLKQNKALPDLSGISVVWIGLGDVVEPQQSLTPSALEALENLWTQVLSEAGASSVTFTADLPGKPAEEELPYVTLVELLQDAPISVDVSDVSFEQPIVLDETKILFLPDSAAFADIGAAEECLRPIAEQMVARPELELVLAGTTSTVGSNEDCKALSKQRAEAVKNLLAELGAEMKRITAIGLGYDHRFHVPDVEPDGKLNGNAPANRSVIVMNANGEGVSVLLASQ